MEWNEMDTGLLQNGIWFSPVLVDMQALNIVYTFLAKYKECYLIFCGVVKRTRLQRQL